MVRSDEFVWYALADPSRRRLLDLLRLGPKTTGALCEGFSFSRTAVMKHLDVLEKARLITVRRSGRERWNYINATPLQNVYERWLTPFQQLWAASLSNFATIVEEEVLAENMTPCAVNADEIVQTIEIRASPNVIFDAFTSHVARWWTHVTYEHAGRPELIFEPRVGGRFYEVLGENQRLYGIVTRIERPSLLCIQGAMGISGCIFGTISVGITQRVDDCELTLRHQVVGLYDREVVEMYRGGWHSLLDGNLRAFVEDGVEAWKVA